MMILTYPQFNLQIYDSITHEKARKNKKFITLIYILVLFKIIIT